MSIKIYQTLIIVLTLISSINANSQDKIRVDSLTQLLNSAPRDSSRVIILVDLWRSVAYNDANEAEAYAREIIRLSKEINFDKGTATGYQRLGIAQSLKGENDSARTNYKKAIAIYQKIDFKQLEGVMLYNLGLIFQDESSYDSALKYVSDAGDIFEQSGNKQRLGAVCDAISSIEQERGNYRIALAKALEALKLYQEIGDTVRIPDAQVKIGDGYYLLGKYQASLPYYQQSIAQYDLNNDMWFKTNTLIKVGQAFHKLNDFDSAKLSFDQAISQAQILDSPTLLADAQFNLGISYFENDLLNEALPLFEASLEESRRIDYGIISSASLINISKIYSARNNLPKALKLALEGLEFAQTSGIKENIKSAYKTLSEIYEKQGLYKQSLTNYIEYKNINDSIYNNTKSSQIAELQTLYETEKKESESEIQKEQIKVLNQEAEIDGLRKKLLTAAIIALLIIGGLIIYSISQKIKRSKLEREKERKNYEKELDFRKRELTTHTLHLVQKNELLTELKQKLDTLRKGSKENKSELTRIIQIIKNDGVAEKDWENFKMYFEQVHQDFDLKLREKINDLTNNEIRLAALMKMNLTTKEIANILNISPDSVNKARYRLRKKLKLNNEDSLTDFILAL